MNSTNRTPLIPAKHQAEIHRVLMKWVTVTDTQGNRRPQMYWWIY